MESSKSSRIKQYREEVDRLVSLLMDSREDRAYRERVSAFVERIMKRALGGECVLSSSGSFPLRMHLFDSDLDMVVMPCSSDALANSSPSSVGLGLVDTDLKLMLKVFQGICSEIARGGATGSSSSGHSSRRPSWNQGGGWNGGTRSRSRSNSSDRSAESTGASGDDVDVLDEEDFTIKNVTFVNGRTKVVNLTVDNIPVDLTINQRGALAAVVFMEEVDRVVSRNHLFKRSVLFVKAFLRFESEHYSSNGHSLLDSKRGMLSTYALNVMLAFIFNKFPKLKDPLEVLRCFLRTFAHWEWGRQVLTLDGPAVIKEGRGGVSFQCPKSAPASIPSPSDGSATPATGDDNGAGSNRPRRLVNRFEAATSKVIAATQAATAAGMTTQLGAEPALGMAQLTGVLTFPIRACNIQDPLDACNNLGYPLSRGSLAILSDGLRKAHERVEDILTGGRANGGGGLSMGGISGMTAAVAPVKADQNGESSPRVSLHALLPVLSNKYLGSPQPRGTSNEDEWLTGDLKEMWHALTAPPPSPLASELKGMDSYSPSEGSAFKPMDSSGRSGSSSSVDNDSSGTNDSMRRNGSSSSSSSSSSGGGNIPYSSAAMVHSRRSDRSPSGDGDTDADTVSMSSGNQGTDDFPQPRTHCSLALDLANPFTGRTLTLDSSASSTSSPPTTPEGTSGAVSPSSSSQGSGSDTENKVPLDTLPSMSSSMSSKALKCLGRAQQEIDASPSSSPSSSPPPTSLPPALSSSSRSRNDRRRKAGSSKSSSSSSSSPSSAAPSGVSPPSWLPSTLVLNATQKRFAFPLAVACIAVAIVLICRLAPSASVIGIPSSAKESEASGDAASAAGAGAVRVVLPRRLRDWSPEELSRACDGRYGELVVGATERGGEGGIVRPLVPPADQASRGHAVHWMLEGVPTVVSPPTLSAPWTAASLVASACAYVDHPHRAVAGGEGEEEEGGEEGKGERGGISAAAPAPSIRFRWMRDGHVVHESVDGILVVGDGDRVAGAMAMTGGAGMRVSGVASTGLLSCVVEYDDGLMVREVLLLQTLLQLAIPPSSTTKGRYFTSRMGSDLALSIDAKGVPQPLFQWYRNGFLLEGQTTAKLYQKGIDRTDEGTYTCIMTNLAGTYEWAEATVVVTV